MNLLYKFFLLRYFSPILLNCQRNRRLGKRFLILFLTFVYFQIHVKWESVLCMEFVKKKPF